MRACLIMKFKCHDQNRPKWFDLEYPLIVRFVI
mgnify:CR=1 FL=1